MSLDNLIHRRGPTTCEQFYASPLLFLARYLYDSSTFYYYQPTKPSSPATGIDSDTIRIACISDTHNAHASLPSLPAGDILIHAGDLSQSGSPQEVTAALDWLAAHPHPHKIFIAGNHDRCLEDPTYQSSIKTLYPDLTYLQNSSTTIHIKGRTIKFYGSPLTPRHGSWAFQYPRIPASQVSSSTIWSSVPMDTDILITHGPPAHHLDHNHDHGGARGSGCNAITDLLWKLRPKLHVFGHIHAARGVRALRWTAGQSAYERISAGGGGWRDLVVICLQLFKSRWSDRRESLGAATTVLVNAAAVGGFRDEKRNNAIVVDI